MLHGLLQDVRALRAEHDKLVEIHDHNSHAFSDSLQMLELQMAVLTRIALDQARQTLRFSNGLPPYEIDYEWYQTHLGVCLAFASFVEWLGGLSYYNEAPLEDEDAVIFGG